VIAFVTSLPHPDVCHSYRKRSVMFLDTLDSVLNQSETDLRVVIVANEPPECALPDDPRIEVVRVGFPPATTLGRPSDVGIEADKGAKLGVGTSVAMRYRPTHLMFVDSDDFIHRDIAALAAAHPEKSGWFADSGYLHQRGSRSVRLLHEGFHLRNGSTHVMRADILAVPDDIDPAAHREEVFERIGRGVVSSTMGRHRPIVGYFETLGAPLSPFPFSAAVWEIGTGENSSGSLAGTGRRVALTDAIARDFAIHVPSRSTATLQAVKVAGARVTLRVKRATSSLGGRRR